MQLRYSPLAVLSLASLASAVSLVDFVPRVNNLPPQCDKVYKSTITGCSGSDFGSSGCSEKCVKALAAMVDPVKSNCGNKDITGQNIIVAFLANMGPQQLCHNAGDFLSSSSSSASSPSSTSAPDQSSSSASSSASSSSEASSTSSAVSSTSSAVVHSTTSAPASTSSGALIVDTSSTPSGTSPATATPSSKNNGSGGGSPFDTGSQTVSLATGLSISLVMVSAGFATTLLAIVGV